MVQIINNISDIQKAIIAFAAQSASLGYTVVGILVAQHSYGDSGMSYGHQGLSEASVEVTSYSGKHLVSNKF